MDKLNLAQVKVLLCAAAELIKDKQQELTDIDGKYGDGDHGITMGKISDAILHGCQTGKQETVSALCDDLGMDMFCVSGGSASSLWGTLFQGFSEAGAAEVMDAPTLKAFLLAGLRGMQEVSTARVGDKTMMDALIPAVEAAVSAGNDIGSILQAASDAASAGMENSKRFASRSRRSAATSASASPAGPGPTGTTWGSCSWRSPRAVAASSAVCNAATRRGRASGSSRPATLWI